MNVDQVLEQLMAQRRNIDNAIMALQQLSNNPSASRALLSFDGKPRRRMSAEAKKRISEMMKKRWAERKRATKSA